MLVSFVYITTNLIAYMGKMNGSELFVYITTALIFLYQFINDDNLALKQDEYDIILDWAIGLYGYFYCLEFMS